MTESLEARLDRIERVTALQQALIDKLYVAVRGHQHVVEALATAAGIEVGQQPAQAAPMTSLN